jgi:hypothetical protein
VAIQTDQEPISAAFLFGGRVLAYVSHARGGIERENLVDDFDCVT